MANYVGEVRMFGGNFAPQDWAFCNGQLLPIAQYDVLFALIGTTYGGDGQVTFGLPNLQGRIPLSQGSGFVIGQIAGEENHTLITGELPSHNHAVLAMTAGNNNVMSGNLYGGGGLAAFKPAPGTAAMNPGVITGNAGNLPHNNLMPFQCVSFIICLFGVFPPRS